MLLAFDIGNTNIVMALHNGEKWCNTWRIHSSQMKTTDEYFLIVKELFSESVAPASSISKAVISSVVPNITRSFVKIVQRLCSLNPIVVSHEVETGLLKQSVPAEIGSDILCNMVYAHKRFPSEFVTVLDFGTAFTCSTVSPQGEIMGVAITPGLITSTNALASNTAQLPQIELKLPQSVLGRDTQQAIRAGIMFGFAGMANALIERTEKEIGQSVKVIATGGLSATISSLIPRIDIQDTNHTLEGMRTVCELNS